MLRSRHLLPTASAILLAVCLPLAVAHGHDEANGGMDMHTGMSKNTSEPAVVNLDDEPAMISYFSYADHKNLIYAHIGLMVVAWVIVLPLGKCRV